MGKVSQALTNHQRVGIDTNVVIYLLDAVSPYASLVTELFDLIEQGRIQAIASTITMLEVMVKPFQLEDQDAIAMCKEFFDTFPNLVVSDVTPAIATRAAQLRARLGLKAPDAVIAATALEANATAFVSNDPHFNRIEDLEVLTLSDLIPQEV